jgi:hypothetical protein
MKISILVPTRERMNNRLTLLFSILTTVNDINNVNIYYGVDKDDPTLETIKKVALAIPALNIIEINNDGKFIGLGKMWNILANETTEEIISMIGDDMVFKTKDWDVKILQEFENIPSDKIKAVHCNDDCHKSALAVNLFCHRNYIKAVGQFMREEFQINWVDQWLHQVFNSVGRIVYRDDIMIEHRHWVLGKSVRDKTADRMAIADTNKVSDKLWYDLVNERIKDVKLISKFVNQPPNWSVVDTTGGDMSYGGN